MPVNVNNPRAADAMRREYDVLGERINLRLDDVIVPVALVADLSPGSAGLPVVRRASATFTIAAVAGQFPVFRVEVPPGAAAILSRIWISLPAAGLTRVHWGSSITAPANIALSTFMDGRLRALGETPTMAIVHGAQVAGLGGWEYYLPGTTGVGIETVLEWPFGRDDGMWDFVEFQCPVVNTSPFIGIQWDEVRLG